MDPIKLYDYLTLARQKVFDWVRPLSAEDYGRQISPGQRTLGQTLTHIMICEWAYVRRIQGLAVPPYDEWPIRDENPPSFAELEAAWIDQADRTRQALSAVRDWETELEYQVIDEGQAIIVNASRSDIFSQLSFHEVHHRAQVMVLLRRLGVSIEDIDYNALMYKRRAVVSPA